MFVLYLKGLGCNVDELFSKFASDKLLELGIMRKAIKEITVCQYATKMGRTIEVNPSK